jgi:ABC-2 type transport system permease protein
MIIGHVGISWSALLLLPLVAELFAAALAVAFFLSALYVRFRDVKHIWDVIMQGAFYGTPILYPLSRIPHTAAKVLILNPVAQIIQDARYVLVTPTATTIGDLYGTPLIWAVPVGLVLLVAVVASLYFRSRSKYFAEEV